MASKDTNEGPVSTTATSFSILEYLVDADGAGITEIANDLGMAKSTVHRHVHTLERLGYIVEEHGAFEIAARTLIFGDYVHHRKEGYAMAEAKVNELAAETGERVQFIVEEHGEGVYVFISHGDRAVMNEPRLGKRFPLHVGASGKVILANLPEDRVWEIIDEHGLPSSTEHTITDAKTLFEELERIRERGHAYNRNEHIEGLNAVGVVIRQPDDHILGTLSIGGPRQRMRGEYFTEELPQLLKGSANEIELNLQHMN